MEFRSVKPPSIVRLLVVREPACELASQSPHRGKGKTSMKSENEAVPAMKLMKLRIASGRGKSMLDNLTFSQCRVHTVGVGVLLAAVILCATPVFAQELRHVAEVMKTTSSGPPSFGPVSAVPPLCSATTGGPGCKFLTVTGVGATGKIVEGDDEGGTFTSTGDVTLLFVLTPSGAHNASGDPTGFCAPSFGSEHWVFEDGSTIDLNRQGSICCAASSCPSGRRVGETHVAHVSTIITGGTGRFLGLKGGGEKALSFPGAIIEEQVWELPSVPEN